MTIADWILWLHVGPKDYKPGARIRSWRLYRMDLDPNTKRRAFGFEGPTITADRLCGAGRYTLAPIWDKAWLKWFLGGRNVE